MQYDYIMISADGKEIGRGKGFDFTDCFKENLMQDENVNIRCHGLNDGQIRNLSINQKVRLICSCRYGEEMNLEDAKILLIDTISLKSDNIVFLKASRDKCENWEYINKHSLAAVPAQRRAGVFKPITKSTKQQKDIWDNITGKKYYIEYEKDKGFTQTFTGCLENFNASGTSAFYNDDTGEFLMLRTSWITYMKLKKIRETA